MKKEESKQKTSVITSTGISNKTNNPPALDNSSDQIETETASSETETTYKIYNNNIMSYVDDFIELEYAGKTQEELKTDKAFFPLLIDYLYNNYIGILLNNKGYKKVTYKDIDLLDNLFNIYTSLVYKYKWNNKPYLIEFSLFTGINTDTFYTWLKGDYDYSYIDNNNGGNGKKYITSMYTDAVRKWVTTCERALLDNNDTIKDIFILKAKHGYKDNNNDINITVNHKAVIDADTLPDLIGITSKN